MLKRNALSSDAKIAILHKDVQKPERKMEDERRQFE